MHRAVLIVALLAVAAVVAVAPAAAASGTIAYQQTDDQGLFQLWSVPAAGGAATQLTSRATAPVPDACLYGCFAEQPEWSADGSRLFFDTDWTPNVHVWSMAPDGTDTRQVTFSDGWDGFPGISPDGATIAFDYTRGDESGGGIAIAPVDGSTPHTQLTSGPKRGWDTHPQYSPDGTLIAFQRFTRSTCPESGCGKRRDGGFGGSIWIMNADGSDRRRITPPGQVWTHPQWSPDGSLLLIQSYNEGGRANGISSDLYTIRPDGSGLTAITRTRKGEHSFSGDWSPDGGRISYVHYRPGDDHLEIQTMAADGSDPQIVTACPSESFCDEPIWGPATTSTRAVTARAAHAPVVRHSRRFARRVRHALVRRLKATPSYRAAAAAGRPVARGRGSNADPVR
jgi:Tol biopolymer transport system component